MNSSMMMSAMDTSLYLDSTTVNKTRAGPPGPPAAGTGGKPKHVRFTSATQTGKNVSKVRWLGDDSFFSVPDPFATEYFISGSSSWIENDQENNVTLWRLDVGPSQKEGEKEAKVNLKCKAPVTGNITGIAALNGGRFCICSSNGCLYTYKCNIDDSEDFTSLQETASVQLFKNGQTKRPATAIAVKDNTSIITVGEEGSIYECSSAGLGVIRKLEKVDPLSISAVSFIGTNEVLTGNEGGQLKLWDLRSASDEPVQILNPNVLMNNLYGVSSICQHPSQTHAIIVGYQSGCMDLWDMRTGCNSDPVANLAGEGGSLSEIYFHQINPDHFFSCAQSGQVCHWYPAEKLYNPLQVPVEYTTDLNIEFLKRGLVFKEVHTSPFPINSISLSRNDRLVVGSDSGVVFCTEVRV